MLCKFQGNESKDQRAPERALWRAISWSFLARYLNPPAVTRAATVQIVEGRKPNWTSLELARPLSGFLSPCALRSDLSALCGQSALFAANLCAAALNPFLFAFPPPPKKTARHFSGPRRLFSLNARLSAIIWTRHQSLFSTHHQSSSPIKNAAVSTVVHNPRLSPTADCVIFIVLTILFEIR